LGRFAIATEGKSAMKSPDIERIGALFLTALMAFQVEKGRFHFSFGADYNEKRTGIFVTRSFCHTHRDDLGGGFA
jgi:hypothetical protein